MIVPQEILKKKFFSGPAVQVAISFLFVRTKFTTKIAAIDVTTRTGLCSSWVLSLSPLVIDSALHHYFQDLFSSLCDTKLLCINFCMNFLKQDYSSILKI